MQTVDNALATYKKVINVCKAPGFFLELDKKTYTKQELTYEFVVKNAARIGYIEASDIEQSRIYLSTFIMLIVVLSMDRIKRDDGIEFVGLDDDVVKLIYRMSLWNINSGYNTAMNDVKQLCAKLSKTSENFDTII